MKVSKRAEYGVRAMVHLVKGKNDKAVSVRELSNIEAIPYNFLAKIFVDLEKAKLVKSKHGANGGYFLARPADKITPGDVMKALNEDTAGTHCSGCKKAGKCKSKSVWSELEGTINKTLSKITLSELIK